MVALVKVDNLCYKTKFTDLRKLFNEHGFRPDNIHFISDRTGRHIGSAFVVFKHFETAKSSLIVDGVLFLNRNITVRASNPREFDKFFPGVPLLNEEERRPVKKRSNSDVYPTEPIVIPAKSRKPDIIENRSRMFESAAKTYIEPIEEPLYLNNQYENNERYHNRPRSPHRRPEEPERYSYSREYRHREKAPRERLPDSRRERKQPNIVGGSDDSDKRFLRVNNLPYNVSDVDIQKFFEPVLTRDVFYLRHESGKLAGKPNGCVVVEFYSESDARQALKLDRKRFGQKTIYINRAVRDDIMQGATSTSSNINVPVIGNIPDVAAVAHNPQVQHLINLLTATVSNLTGGAAENVTPSHPPLRDDRRRERKREVNDPVISRVATSANINVGDISMGKVVGIRNLPYSVTPGEILQFFKGYHAVPDSVRIHYLEDGRCSGDAIISFRNSRDARAAVSSLNKRTIARRKIELFFL